MKNPLKRPSEIISDGHRIDLTRVLYLELEGKEPGWDLDESRRIGVMVWRGPRDLDEG